MKNIAMNKHILLDNLTATIGAMVAGRKKFFAKSIESETFEDNISGIKLLMPKIDGEGVFDVPAKTMVGMIDPAFCVAKWKGKDYPTVIYHHGNNERPFEFKKTAKNTFFNIFLNSTNGFGANLIVVRAPFHNCKLGVYQEKMTELQNFVAMISASVRLNEALISRLRDESNAPIITSGISLGGWVTNLHRAIFNTSTAYAPLMAGTYLGELFLKSKYRKMASDIALNNPDEIRRILNFNEIFEKKNSQNVYPLLAKHDQFIEYDVQRKSYNGSNIKTIEKGHVTGALSTLDLKNHIIEVKNK